MKRIITLTALVFAVIGAFAEQVKLKITYKGNGISGHTVSVMIGGGVLGSGVTDDNGEVTINVSTLPTKSIDLKGEKKCDGAEKKWEVKGYVTLDNNNYGHLKMEEPIAEMVEASGGFMSESMMVGSYGLICGGSSSSGGASSSNSASSSSSNSGSSSSTNNSSASSSAPPLMTQEEALANQKVLLENKLSSLDNKIEKNQQKIDDGKVEGEKKEEAMYDIQEWQVEKKITQNKLDKVNLQIEKGSLNKSERENFKNNEEEYEAELDQIKEDRKKGKSLVSEEEKEEAIEVTAEEMSAMNTMQLKKKRLDYKTKLGKLNVKLKTKRKQMSPDEINQTETQIKQLEDAIAVMDAELAKRGESAEEPVEEQ